MTSDDWNRLQDCFALALSLDAAARERYLAELDRTEPGFATRLRRLLAADAASDAAARGAVDACVESLARDTPDPWIGRMLGGWRIARRLAGGGMGAVFVAERTDGQFAQTVAIKVMAAQLVHPAAVARFRAERQILASLNHPYIAKLIDGGTGTDGLPFLVMEYVDGLPIDEYCRRHSLDVPARLQLFRRVCEAIDYAHRRLVVHRDLKPSNILVDAEGAPRLLDFGIAKLLESSDAASAGLTRAGGAVLTPEFASPEQVRGEPVSVATDVYSLGVLLFRLLTGQSPYGRSVATPAEYLRAIVSDDPQRPSTVVPDASTTPGPAVPAPTAAARDAAAIARMRRQLAGDLDNIILKALQKSPDRRYATASAFAADIGRHLEHQPVEARGDDFGYRAARFMRRHLAAVVAATLLVTSVTGLVAFYTLRLADERDRAEIAAARAQEVSRFVGTLFEGASPYRTQGEAVSAVDLLRRGVQSVDELEGEPQVQAELLRIIGRSLTALGDFAEAVPLLERALSLKQAAPAPDELSIAETLLALGESLRLRGDPARAAELIRQSLEIRQRRLGDSADETIITLGRLGNVLFDLRQPEESLKHTREALDRMIANGQGESSAAVDMRGNIAIALDYLGRYDEAAALLRETIAMSDRLDGVLNPDTVIRMSNLGLVLMRQGRLNESVAQFDATLERARRSLPPKHPQIVIALALQGAALKRLGQMDRAYRQYSEAAGMVLDTEGERSAAYVARLRGLANMQVEMARYDEAVATLRRAMALSVELQGENSPLMPPLRVLLAQAWNGLGRFEEAEAELRAELALGERTSATVSHVLQRELARALGLQGRHLEAEPLMLKALSAQEAALSADSPTLIPFLAAASAHYQRAGDPQRALGYAERADAIRRAAGEDAGWEAAEAMAAHGRALAELGRKAEARDRWREAETLLVRTFGESDPRVIEVRRLLRG